MFDCFSVLCELKERKKNSTQEDEKSFTTLLGYKATEQDGNVKWIQTDNEREYME